MPLHLRYRLALVQVRALPPLLPAQASQPPLAANNNGPYCTNGDDAGARRPKADQPIKPHAGLRQPDNTGKSGAPHGGNLRVRVTQAGIQTSSGFTAFIRRWKEAYNQVRTEASSWSA